MIPEGVQIFVALAPIDMRASFDRLAGLAQGQVGYDPRCGALFVFFGKTKTSVKILFADTTGYAIFYKRLFRGTFCLPEGTDPTAGHVEIDATELDALLDGISIERRMH